MPASPCTPIHSRHPSHISISSPTPSTSARRDSHGRRHSRTSINTPSTPSFLERSNTLENRPSNGNTPATHGMGLGNLADELGDAWSEDEEGDVDVNFQTSEGHGEGLLQDEGDPGEANEGMDSRPTRDSGVDVGEDGVSIDSTAKRRTLAGPMNRSPGTARDTGKSHARQGSEYDGSDYGQSSDLESPGLITPSLASRMDTIEGLARRGTEKNGGTTDGIVHRVVEGLKDLGGQSGVENNATRLITAHTALSTHLLHQTRTMHTLTYPILSPLAPSPDPDLIETILPLLEPLREALPRPNPQATMSLASLHGTTIDLIQTLTYLSDTLHMSRQTTIAASRRLRSARELVAEMKREEEAAEEGELWLRKGNWGEKLQRRDCRTQCEGVVGGFEEVCGRVRGRLVEMAAEVGA